MGTTAVGVRDLKERATQLVRRAARGERVVITRYGKPYAVLGPVEAQPEAPPGSRMSAWLAERRAFELLSPGLLRKHVGKYVAVHRGRVVGSDADPERLHERTWRKLRGETFFVGRVGASAPVIDMPGFEIA